MNWKRGKRRQALTKHPSYRGWGIIRKQRELAKDAQRQASEQEKPEPELTRAAFEEARFRLLRDVRFHQAHCSCWCGETHDLFEATDLNDALEEEAMTNDPEGKALWERFERPLEAPKE